MKTSDRCRFSFGSAADEERVSPTAPARESTTDQPRVVDSGAGVCTEARVDMQENLQPLGPRIDTKVLLDQPYLRKQLEFKINQIILFRRPSAPPGGSLPVVGAFGNS